MVITLSSHIDGHSHAQPVAIEAQEGQDPDEPPIHLPSPTLEKQPQREKPLPVSVLQDDDTAANSVIDIASKDGSLTTLSAWDGNPDTAHVSDGTVVAAHLGVNPQYVLYLFATLYFTSHLESSANKTTDMDFLLLRLYLVLNGMALTKSMVLAKCPSEKSCSDKSPTA